MLLPAFILLSAMIAKANDSCLVLFNKQVIFKGEVEQQNAIGYIKAKQFKSSDCVTIKYYAENISKGWKRTFYIEDATGSNVKTIELGKQSGAVAMKASILNELKEKKQPFSIYTISLPTDKAMAARVRVRRMFICKVEWN